MDLYPAIDLREGRVVRLRQGDFATETSYGDDPVSVAREFADAGAPWIHVVDLDAARTGSAHQHDVIAAICAAVDAPVQCGGGVRNAAAGAALFDAGVARVVIGTAAVRNPELVTELSAEYPGRVAVGLDARGRAVAVSGWQETTGADVVELAWAMEAAGAAALVVTEIGRDGMMTGPDLDQLRAVLTAVATPVIASGGVGDLADLEALRDTEAGGRRPAGVIVGRALYEGRFELADALVAVSD